MIAQDLENIFLMNPHTVQVLEDMKKSQSVCIRNIHGGARLFIVNILFKNLDKNILCVAQNEDESKRLFDDLLVLCNDDVEYYPALGRHTWSDTGPLASTVGRRLFTIKAMYPMRANRKQQGAEP